MAPDGRTPLKKRKMKLKKQSILIIDDEFGELKVLEKELNANYQTQRAEGMKDVFEILESEKNPDMILLPLTMKTMNGCDILAKFKTGTATRHVPAIILAEKDEAKYETLCFSLGAVDFIQKPFRLSVVKARLAVHLKLSDKLRQLQQSATSSSGTSK